MIPMKRVGLLAGAATLTLAGGSFADTDLEAQNQELRSRIADLESRLGAIEAQDEVPQGARDRERRPPVTHRLETMIAS